jgi:hypothetical protein
MLGGVLCVPLAGHDTGDGTDPAARPEAAVTQTPTAHSFLGSRGFIRVTERPDKPVEWAPLSRNATMFLGLLHGFRLATEPGTREGLRGPFFPGWADSLAAMHGWSDGDPFLVNYIGHPMQGAVTGLMFVHHDPKYRNAEFGRNRRYWMSRLRAMGYAWAFSTQFEIGPLSEATIGNIQAKYPAYGFVDHVVTPIIGLGWTVVEDALDEYVIRRLERRSSSGWVRIPLRIALNPARGMANLMTWKEPWYRETRLGVFTDPELAAFVDEYKRNKGAEDPPEGLREIPVFELSALPDVTVYGAGSGNLTLCAGGGAGGQFNLSREWSLRLEVGGCKRLGLGEGITGDSLGYLAGPRWSWRRNGRWTPYAHVLIGGHKVTSTRIVPEAVEAVRRSGVTDLRPNEVHPLIAVDTDSNAFAFRVGGGVDVALSRALVLELGSFDYLRTWLGRFEGRDLTNSLRFGAGLKLRFGTW